MQFDFKKSIYKLICSVGNKKNITWFSWTQRLLWIDWYIKIRKINFNQDFEFQIIKYRICAFENAN